MKRNFIAATMLAAAASTCATSPVVAQTSSTGNFPARPIRVLAPPTGGMADIAGRLAAQAASVAMGQTVVVDNRPGIVSVETTAKAAPDGYTVLLTAQSMWISPLMGRKVPYDPIKDFAPITLAVGQHNMLAVHPTVPANSVKELIALAKAKPGELNYASGPSGGGPHLAAELFKSMAGIQMTRVPYKGSAQALTDLLSGSVQVMFAPLAAMPNVKAGRLKALAVTSARPSVLAPGLPPLTNILPGYEHGGVAAFFAPAGTPVAAVNRLHKEITTALNATDTKEKLLAGGIEVIASTPQQLGATVKSDMVKMGKVIRDAGIKEE